MPTRVCSGALAFKPPTACDQLQPRPHRPLGVVLMGLRIAEVHEHAVAHVLRHEPAEALHSLGDALLIGGNDLAQVLRVHARRECRRADEVREHHRDLAALGSVLMAWARRCRLAASVLGRLAGIARYRAQHLQSMTEREPRYPSGLVGEIAQEDRTSISFSQSARAYWPRPSFSSQSVLLSSQLTTTTRRATPWPLSDRAYRSLR